VSAVRSGVRGLGELMITAGVVLLLFVVYQLYWTNVEAERRQDQVAEGLREDWQRPSVPAVGEGAASAPGTAPGRGLAFLRIPRLGAGYSVPVVEGVDLDDLARGVGHYPGSAAPGRVGNFAVAGHRATNGEPFRDLDRMRPGDDIVVETRRSWFTYEVDRTQIVEPTDIWVIDPVPGEPQAEPTERLLTLTTCHPRWASTERLIVFAHLARQQDKSAGPPPALAVGG
jgi:sortase A